MFIDIETARAILPARTDIMAMASVFSDIAQSSYDEWEPVDDGPGNDGIDDLIAGRMVDAVSAAFPKSQVLSTFIPRDRRVVTLMAVREGVLEIDIPRTHYEISHVSGAEWRKRPDVMFSPDMVTFTDMDADPRNLLRFMDPVVALYHFRHEDAIPEGSDSVSLQSFYRAAEMLADIRDRGVEPASAPTTGAGRPASPSIG